MSKNQLTTAENKSVAVQSAFSPSALTKEQSEIIKTQIAPGISDNDLMYCLEIAKEAQLNPIIKDIYFVPRKASINGQWVSKHEPMIGRKGARAIARRKGMKVPPTTGHTIKLFPYLDQSGEWQEKRDLVGWAEIMIEGQKVRKEAAFSVYKQTTKQGEVTKFWREMPTVMVEKVAEFQLLDAIYGLDGIMSIDAGVLSDEGNFESTNSARVNTTNSIDSIEDALRQIGLGLDKQDEIAYATGNTFNHAKALQSLGFVVRDSKWIIKFVEEAEVVETTATDDSKEVSDIQDLADLGIAIEELGGKLTAPKPNSKGEKWVMANVEEDADGVVAKRLNELNFVKKSGNWVRKVDDLVKPQEPTQDSLLNEAETVF